MSPEAVVMLAIKARDDASGVMDKVRGNAGALGSALGKIGAIAAGVGIGTGLAAFPGFLASATQAAADDAASVAKLQQAVANAGGSWQQYGGFLEQVISRGQKLAFSDDQTRDSMSLLIAQTGNVAEATRRYALAQDLARGANIDVVTASRLLGKVTEENANVLNRYGIVVKKGASEQELFAQIQARFGGQAQAFADSTAGRIARLKDAFSELKEQIGYAMLPVLTALAGFALGVVVPMLQRLATLLDGTLGAALRRARAALDPLVQLFRTGFNGGRISGEFSAIEKAAFKFGQTARGVFDFFQNHKETIIGALAAIGLAVAVTVVPPFIAWAAATLIALAPLFLLIAAGAVLALVIKRFLPDLHEWAEGVMPRLQAAAAAILPHLEAFADNVVSVARTIVEFVENAGLLDAALDGLKTILAAVQSVFELLAPPIQKVIGFLLDHKATVIILVAALGLLLVALFPIPIAIAAIVIAIGYLSEHWDTIKAKTLAVWGAISDFIDERLGYIKTIVVDVIGEVRDQIELGLTVIKDIFKIVMALVQGDWGAAWDGIKRLASDVIEGVKTLVVDRLNLLNDLFGGFPGRILGKLADWANAGFQAGAAIANGIVGAIKGVLGGAVDIADALIGAIRGAWNALADWIEDHAPHVHIPNPFGPDVDIGISIPHLARGGVMAAAGLALVGEQGPEIVALPRGARVFSNADSRAASQQIVQHIYIDQNVISGDPQAGLAALGLGAA